MIDSTSTLIAPPVQPALSLEEALQLIREGSYREGWEDGRKQGYRDALAYLHQQPIVVKDKDALGHGSNKRGQQGPTKVEDAGKKTRSPMAHLASAVRAKSKEHQEVIERTVERLKAAGKAVMATKAARWLKAAEHKLFYVSHKTRDIAIAAAKERNLSPEGADRLKRVLFIADFVGGYVTGAIGGAIGGAVGGGAGGVTGAKIGMLMPSASVLFLAYSTAKDPVATWKAARSVIKDAASMIHKAVEEAPPPGRCSRLDRGQDQDGVGGSGLPRRALSRPSCREGSHHRHQY